MNLLQMLQNNQVEDLIKLSKTFKSYPLVIPSYKLKSKAKLVREIDTLIGHDIPVFIFCYKDDYTESGYDKIPHGDNVQFVLIEEKDFKEHGCFYKSIQGKRSFIQDWMFEHGHYIYFTSDDDASGKGRMLISEYPRKIVNVDLDNMLRIASKISEQLPSGWMMLALGCNIDVLGSNFKDLWYIHRTYKPRKFCLLNIQNMKEKNVHYTGYPKDFFEDLKICFDIAKAGDPMYVIKYMAPSFAPDGGKNSTMNYKNLYFGTIKMFKDNCNPTVADGILLHNPCKGQEFIENGCRYEWFKTDKYHRKLAELIDKAENTECQEYEDIVTFIKNYVENESLEDW